MKPCALLILLVPLAGLYGGCAYTIEEPDLFYPRQVSLEYWPNQRPVSGVRISPVAIRRDGGVLRGWLFTPPEVHRYMVHFYGNGELVAAESVAVRLVYLARRLECEILVMDYRGYGFTAGRPTFENIQADGLLAYDFMVNRAGGRGVLVYGLSIGTVPAVHVAAERKVTGLVLQAPPTSAAEIIPGFRRMIPIPVRWFIRVRPSQELIDLHPQPVELVRRVSCPLLVIHGLEDKIIPARFGRRMYEQAGSKSKHWLEVPGAGHNNLSLADEQTTRTLKQFARSCDRQDGDRCSWEQEPERGSSALCSCLLCVLRQQASDGVSNAAGHLNRLAGLLFVNRVPVARIAALHRIAIQRVHMPNL